MSYTMSNEAVQFIFDNEIHGCDLNHPQFNNIKQHLGNGDYQSAYDALNLNSAYTSFLPDRITMEDGVVMLDDVPMPELIGEKILAMLSSGNGPEPLLNFLDKVAENPSYASQQELLLFINASGFLLHEDGDILAFKRVRDDYYDHHSGTVYYGIGSVVEMPRNQVDDNRDRTCSAGLHFASVEYATGFAHSGPVMLMKVNPRDVVSIPSDYNNQKGRACRLTVLAEMTNIDREVAVYTDDDFSDEGEDLYAPVWDADDFDAWNYV